MPGRAVRRADVVPDRAERASGANWAPGLRWLLERRIRPRCGGTLDGFVEQRPVLRYVAAVNEHQRPRQGLSMEEQETTVVRARLAEWTVIETTVPTDITALRARSGFVEEASGYFGTTEWARFRIRSSEWNPARGAKRRMTEEQKRAAGERLRQLRG